MCPRLHKNTIAAMTGFIFDNRVEIISPGALAGGLTEDDIRKGNTYQRNPFMATFATNALHYRGIGSGIVRILADYPSIDIENDADGNEFKVILWRTTQKNEATPQITTQKNDNATPKDIDATQKKVLDYFKQHPKGTRIEAAEAIGNNTADGVKFIIGKLQQKGLLKRVGGRKLGEWQVLI